MKGAVQGAATTTARIPVKKAPTPPGRRASGPDPAPCRPAPMWKTPDRFRATASISRASPAVTGGDCSWKPQPTASPAARSASRTPASSRKVVSTPARKARPSRRAWRGSWAAVASDAAFIARMGKTHGIRFRISPPRTANSSACRKTSGRKPASGPAGPASTTAARAPDPVVPARVGPGSARISKAPSAVTSTPPTGPDRPVARVSPPGCSRSVRPCGPQAPVWAAGWSMTPPSNGKK